MLRNGIMKPALKKHRNMYQEQNSERMPFLPIIKHAIMDGLKNICGLRKPIPGIMNYV